MIVIMTEIITPLGLSPNLWLMSHKLRSEPKAKKEKRKRKKEIEQILDSLSEILLQLLPSCRRLSTIILEFSTRFFGRPLYVPF